MARLWERGCGSVAGSAAPTGAQRAPAVGAHPELLRGVWVRGEHKREEVNSCVKGQGQEEAPPPVPIPPESGFPGAHPACVDSLPPSRFWGSRGASPAEGAGRALRPHRGCVCPRPGWAGGLPRRWRVGRCPQPRAAHPRPGEVPTFLRRLRGEPGAGAGRECRGAECVNTRGECVSTRGSPGDARPTPP